MRKRLGVLAVAAALVGLTPATASATTAATTDELCPFTDTLCLFDGEDYTGTRLNVAPMGSDAVCVDLVEHGWGGGRAKSAINTSTRTANMFQYSTDCTGYGAPIHTGRTPDFNVWFSPKSVLISS
ncbi:peptidase inhibitor family I36 protein [Nonomuraea wenchangensis]|uniref:peptidase inhibitor family I36 protein n=1 Tax=Nonomuraea wenchangensis TaxID=568860 RepID=UPI0037A52F2A